MHYLNVYTHIDSSCSGTSGLQYAYANPLGFGTMTGLFSIVMQGWSIRILPNSTAYPLRYY